jgi:hypothetical protein
LLGAAVVVLAVVRVVVLAVIALLLELLAVEPLLKAH